MLLLEEAVHEIKMEFNRRFLALRAVRKSAVDDVRSSSRRIAEITVELDDAGAGSGEEFRVNAEDPRYYTLTVHSDRRILTHNADRTEDGALVWERPIGSVIQHGILASAMYFAAPAWLISYLRCGLRLSRDGGGAKFTANNSYKRGWCPTYSKL